MTSRPDPVERLLSFFSNGARFSEGMCSINACELQIWLCVKVFGKFDVFLRKVYANYIGPLCKFCNFVCCNADPAANIQNVFVVMRYNRFCQLDGISDSDIPVPFILDHSTF